MQIEFKASKRDVQGTGASRRLRHAGQIPGILYGGAGDALPLSFDHNELYHLLRKEVFHSSVLTLNLDGKKENVILRATQWHAYKPQVLHLDFQRVRADEKLHMKVPLHFINGEASPAVKLGGCMISHTLNEVDVSCLPADLPESITVDLAAMEAGQSLHISQLELPAGVELVAHGDDQVIATALVVMAAAGDEEEKTEDGEA